MTSHVDDRTRFVRMRVAADAHSATQARVEFRSWLDRHFTLGPERFSDLLLAVSEALANAAEFAYVDSGQPGTMDFSAAYDVDSDSLAVTIADRGRWRPSVPERTPDRRFQIRGRGIPLMQALADEAVIDRTPDGTHVTLRWTYLTRQSPTV